ncbi:MAG: nucleotide exchange factor GrpE [Anaerolineaceae bacterium]|nr:nucleotide exchange factor GrpE [Anaerolineaceae bacterium]
MSDEEKKSVEEEPKHPSGEKTVHDKKKEETQHVPAHEHEALKSELAKVRGEATANMDGWQRERAEFSNYKKRIDRENAQLRQTLTGEVIKKYLVILDDLELALKARPKEGEGASWSEGIELIARKLQSILEAEGIERINQNKIQFDPNLHEAISNEDAPDFESGEVIEVVRQGYKIGDRILRPAMVRVAR